jgi:hypothetical protein
LVPFAKLPNYRSNSHRLSDGFQQFVISITVYGVPFQYTRSRRIQRWMCHSAEGSARRGEKKAENPTMVRGMHPEFGYLCLSLGLRRRLWLASLTCALAGASGLGMFMTRANLEALAFAPVGSQSLEASPATQRITHMARFKSAFVADPQSGVSDSQTGHTEVVVSPKLVSRFVP